MESLKDNLSKVVALLRRGLPYHQQSEYSIMGNFLFYLIWFLPNVSYFLTPYVEIPLAVPETSSLSEQLLTALKVIGMNCWVFLKLVWGSQNSSEIASPMRYFYILTARFSLIGQGSDQQNGHSPSSWLTALFKFFIKLMIIIGVFAFLLFFAFPICLLIVLIETFFQLTISAWSALLVESGFLFLVTLAYRATIKVSPFSFLLDLVRGLVSVGFLLAFIGFLILILMVALQLMFKGGSFVKSFFTAETKKVFFMLAGFLLSSWLLQQLLQYFIK